MLYTTIGAAWTDFGSITYSYMPDGTQIAIGSPPSSLFQTMNSYMPTSTWQNDIQQAAASWEAVARLNLSLTTDNGAPVGSGPYQQGNPSFGDIRVGAMPLPSGYLAETVLPPPINGDSSAGDIFINSNVNWGPGGYDFETVMLHEMGHALGMGHSAISTAVMYSFYNGVKQNLTGDDIAGIQANYAPPPTDYSNNTWWTTATDITSLIGSNDQLSLPGLYLNGAGDEDFYKIVVPQNTNGTFTVTMQTKNISSVSPWMGVFNADGNYWQVTSEPGVYGGTVSQTITGAYPGQVWYIWDQPAPQTANAPGSAGSYGIQVNFSNQAQAPIPGSVWEIANQPSQGGWSSPISTTGGGATGGNQGNGSDHGNGGDHASHNSAQPTTSGHPDPPVLMTVGSKQVWGDALTVDPSLLPPGVSNNAGVSASVAPGSPALQFAMFGATPMSPAGLSADHGSSTPSVLDQRIAAIEAALENLNG